MKVFLAGYNLDAEVIEELKRYTKNRDDITPETLSAAYARISRDPRPINELRQAARQEVEKSRKSNTSIIFNLGHSSVAEHAVFNFDVIDVSRYAMEELEKFRLCSFTEKSQRYITLDSSFIVPAEIKGTRFENDFIEMIKKQNDMYNKLFEQLNVHVFEKHKDLAQDPKNKNLLEGWAKEDARYITSLSTCSQVGMTINARNLEKLIRRFSSHPLKEIQNIGKAFHTLVKDIAPSIIKYPESNDFDKNTYNEIQDEIVKIFGRKIKKDMSAKPIFVNSFTKNGDDLILGALIQRSTNLSLQRSCNLIRKKGAKAKKVLFKAAVRNMKIYDQPIREFELAEVVYDIPVSAACFGQLKRHRMATIISQKYNPKLGLVVPPSIKEIDMEKEFKKVAEESADLYKKIKEEIPLAAEYILTNSHQKRVIFKTNLRELYHISRLREDAHAQWDIRVRSALLVKEAKKLFPVCTSFIGGKDVFSSAYKKLFE